MNDVQLSIDCFALVSFYHVNAAFWQVSGLNGALNIVRLLKQRNVHLSFLLDEGLLVVDGVMKGLDGPAAL